MRSEKLDTNLHSVFKLYYHLIICTKYRRKVITDEISQEIKTYFIKYADKYKVTLEEWGSETDHIHIVFRAQPQTEIAKFINAFKSASSRLVKKNHPEIKKSLWKEYFWSRSYCLLTTGGAPLEIIKEYVKSQGE